MRPDAERVWKNKEIQSRFSRYFAIIKKEKVARYLITKKVQVSVKFDSSIATEKLWDEHDRAAGKFNNLLRELDMQQNPSKYLEDLDSRFDERDPRLDPYMKELKNYFFGEDSWNYIFIPSDKPIQYIFINLFFSLPDYGSKWIISDFNISREILSILFTAVFFILILYFFIPLYFWDIGFFINFLIFRCNHMI